MSVGHWREDHCYSCSNCTSTYSQAGRAEEWARGWLIFSLTLNSLAHWKTTLASDKTTCCFICKLISKFWNDLQFLWKILKFVEVNVTLTGEGKSDCPRWTVTLLLSRPTCLRRSLSRLEALPCSSRDLEYFTACSRCLSFSLPSSRLADSQSWRSLRKFQTNNALSCLKAVTCLAPR